MNVSTDAAPCPRVEVLFNTFAAGTTAVDVYRLAGGREYLVRGAVKTAVAGALSRIDFEVPFGVPVQYRAEMFNSSGLSLGFTDTATTTVFVAETWVHNPLDPQGATIVAFRATAAREVKRPHEGDIVWPEGRTVGVVVSGQRRGVQDAVLDVIVDSIVQADKLQAMFGSYGTRTTPVICFRIGANDRVRLPRPFFAGILELSEQDQNYAIGTGEKIAYGMTGSEVSPPTPALVVPLLTRADLNAAFATRAALNSFFLTRLDANRAYQFAGSA
ncbi:hypothetical protein [uncultured Leifsonia sp.]|uniref:hypothetical protein n=1 Tax=uncultured Leifsonia sp. TaxID=340359 RepID=UPI0026205410|nr:hypothetical protein [uncultured Leifsonia sp.]